MITTHARDIARVTSTQAHVATTGLSPTKRHFEASATRHRKTFLRDAVNC